MPLSIIREDITKLTCDAIVNAANNSLLGGGGVDGAIHKAAGRELLVECRSIGGCNTGEAKITSGYKLPAKYIIHTVGPVWNGGNCNEEFLLRSCYRNSLLLAKRYNCESVAFPLISSGAYGYPKNQALQIATEEISRFLLENDMLVYIVIFDRKAFDIGRKLFLDIEQYIDDVYVKEHSFLRGRFNRPDQSKLFGKKASKASSVQFNEGKCEEADISCSIESMPLPPCAAAAEPTVSLQSMIDDIDESFSEMLIRKIDESGMKDSECYKRANIDRKLFSKIKNNINYNPSKTTAIAFAIALRLSIEETKNLLMKAGFALSHSNKFDIIIEYFILNKNYNIFEINEALFAFDQSLLGA